MRMKQFWKWPAVFLALLTLASGVPAGAVAGTGNLSERGPAPSASPEPLSGDPELAGALTDLARCVECATDPALTRRGGIVGLRSVAADIEAAVLSLDRRLPESDGSWLLNHGLLADLLAGAQALGSPSKRVREEGRALLARSLPHLRRLSGPPES